MRARVEEKMPDNLEWVDQIGKTGGKTRDAVDAISIEQAHKVFQRWLGDDYDTDALDIMLAVAAAEQFNDGSDPIWLLLISGP
ncbi:MAG TPA: hypothetical protein VN255_15285, partial [Mycobacterium sp.]|nr:hypothetical protein [Mycobacterium sp.]